MTQRVLVDTSALYALVSASDAFHTQVREAYTRLIDEGAVLYLTSYILLESSALIHRRVGFPVLQQIMSSLRDTFTVVWVDRELHDRAWDLLQQRTGQLSLVDCSAIVVAKQLEAKVFAFDNHYRQEGIDYTVI